MPSILRKTGLMALQVGGNFFDLMTRTVSVVIGALWGALAYFSRDGDPFVMAAFAAVFAHPAGEQNSLLCHYRF